MTNDKTPGTWQSADYVDHYNRNYAWGSADLERYLGPLRLGPDDVFADFGCGEGIALDAAAPRVRAVVGIDTAPAQLDLARRRLAEKANAMLIAGDFLTFPLPDTAFTKGGARKALHHLTDPEKAQFFARVGPRFEPGGLFHLEDGVFTFARADLDAHWDQVLAEAAVHYGDRWTTVRADVTTTLRDEFVTGFDEWAAAMAAGGFTVIDRWHNTCFYGGILCRKE